MSMSSTTPDDATVDATNTSSTTIPTIVECDDDGGVVDSSLLEMLGLTMSELQQLSALSVESPRAPANSLESLDSHAGPSEDTGSPETRRSSFGSSDRAGERLQPAPVGGDSAINETVSEKAKAQRPSHSAVPLSCVAVLTIVFLLAFAYGVFLFRLAHIPGPDKKTGVHRSANDTGADRD
ncbi:uncharacterized protein LOC119402715 [Rhipicephalus sanguineus]|uniref:uncharacterized protein LOC119402715 n=1 Tax=Rhipicephalus sanguineus TaxID=34632 RepID=UPI0018945CA9|nr:uncharacterized protein LOC119402715 [Rhipicephalus sanguineus]